MSINISGYVLEIIAVSSHYVVRLHFILVHFISDSVQTLVHFISHEQFNQLLLPHFELDLLGPIAVDLHPRLNVQVIVLTGPDLLLRRHNLGEELQYIVIVDLLIELQAGCVGQPLHENFRDALF